MSSLVRSIPIEKHLNIWNLYLEERMRRKLQINICHVSSVLIFGRINLSFVLSKLFVIPLGDYMGI